MLKLLTNHKLNEFDRLKRRLLKEREKFTIVSTGTSKTIEYSGFKWLFADELHSKTLPMYSMINANIKRSNVVIDEVPREQIYYYDICERYRRTGYEFPETIINIDLNNAYLQALFNVGAVDERTFDFCLHPKECRLKAVGMLAKRQLIFYYDRGECIGWKMAPKKETENHFFYACYEVDKLLNKMATLFNDYFLFYWFDGIYLKPDAPAEEIIKEINDAGYKCKKDILFDISINTNSTRLFMQYSKLKEGEEKRKSINIPVTEKKERENFSRYIKEMTIKNPQIIENNN